MQRDAEERLARVLRHRRASRRVGGEEPSPARSAALAEIPRLLARLADTVAEFNDALAPEGAALRLSAAGHTPTREAVAQVRLAEADERAPNLVLQAGADVVVHTFVVAQGRRQRLGEPVPASALDRPMLEHFVVALLESLFPSP